jgi:hypothetical protein
MFDLFVSERDVILEASVSARNVMMSCQENPELRTDQNRLADFSLPFRETARGIIFCFISANLVI